MKTPCKIICILTMMLLCISATNAQQPVENKTTTVVKKNADQQRQATSKERRGSISGRVISDNGQPLTNIGVNLFQQAATVINTRNLAVDEDGRFQADDLPAGAYSISTYVPGYVDATPPKERRYYRLGDIVTLNMAKGGVITGMVKNAAGEPVIGVMVSALRVRDTEGKPQRSGQSGRPRQTDDRGVYRLYGLPAGTYIVFAGGRDFFTGQPSKYTEDVPTYFPSSTRDTAAEIPLQTGQEATNIDINYRGEKGRAISGTVTGAMPTSANYSISLTLTNATSGTVDAATSINSFENKRSFAFYGVVDGEYFLTANSQVFNEPKQSSASTPRRISVRGDVSGLEVTLVPHASLSGAVILEPLAEADKKKCPPSRDATLEETVISLRPDTKGETNERQWFTNGSVSALNEKGEFTFTRLNAGRYRLATDLPSDNWYLKEIVLQPAGNAKQPKPASLQLRDAATKGITLKTSENLDGLKIVLAEGAANLSGRVIVDKEGDAPPAKLLVHIVPFEKERANEVLRYAQAEVKSDGTFTLANLAPGKYYLLARIAEESNEIAPRALAWDAVERAALRKEADTASVTIELQTCQRLSDYSLRFAGKSKK